MGVLETRPSPGLLAARLGVLREVELERTRPMGVAGLRAFELGAGDCARHAMVGAEGLALRPRWYTWLGIEELRVELAEAFGVELVDVRHVPVRDAER